LNEANARNLLLVRAIEIHDHDETLLPRAERLWATRSAQSARAGDEEAFLAERAALLQARLSERQPLVSQAWHASHWPLWSYFLVSAVALVAGLLTNVFGPAQRIQLIAFPLLGMLAWNLGLYLWLAWSALLGRSRAPQPVPWSRWFGRINAFARRKLDGTTPLGKGLQQFYQDWLRHAAALMSVRLRLALHLGAACLAAGTVAGMYARGLGYEYLAGWESTFIDPATLHLFLRWVLGPAAALSGIALPDPEHLAGLRWGPGQPGENAASWIHLYAVTALLFIILPRLALGLASGVRVLRLRRDFWTLDPRQPYARKLLRAAHGKSSQVQVLAYSYHPSPGARAHLDGLLADALGAALEVDHAAPIAYGAEEEFLEHSAPSPDDTHTAHAPADFRIVLFSLAATPEEETHGALLRGLAQQTPAPLAVLDSAPLRARLSGSADLKRRMQERITLWRDLLQRHGVGAIALDLLQPGPDDAQRLEQALHLEGTPS